MENAEYVVIHGLSIQKSTKHQEVNMPMGSSPIHMKKDKKWKFGFKSLPIILDIFSLNFVPTMMLVQTKINLVSISEF